MRRPLHPKARSKLLLSKRQTLVQVLEGGQPAQITSRVDKLRAHDILDGLVEVVDNRIRAETRMSFIRWPILSSAHEDGTHSHGLRAADVAFNVIANHHRIARGGQQLIQEPL